MSSQHSLAKLAMRALADARLDVAEVSRRESEHAVAAIARELAAVRNRRRRRWTGFFALAAAATLLLTFGLAWRRSAVAPAASVGSVSGGVMLVRGDHGRNMSPGDGVAQGDRVVASAQGSATLRLRRGTELRAVRGADVLVAEQGASQIFDLHAGAVELHVAKLHAGERFIVRTGDAEVEVRGTEFSVEVGETCAGTTTHVAVTEGTVVVRHAGIETRLTANESWPATCDRRASAASTSPPLVASVPSASSSGSPSPSPASHAPERSTPAAVPAALPPTSTNATARPTSATATPSSDLAEQNRLFADAMAAKRRGDVPAAVASLDRLSAAYPSGPLAESADVERMRALVGVDHERAADAARVYLARHPNGYARDEARALTPSR